MTRLLSLRYFKFKKILIYIKYLILIFLFVFMGRESAMAASGDAAKEFIPPVIYLNKRNVTDSDPDDLSVFIFSDGDIENKKKENLVFLFSKVKINAEITGNVYSFFSEIELQEGSATNIYTFSSVVTKNDNFGDSKIISFLEGIDFLCKKIYTDVGIKYVDVIPIFLIILFFVIIKIFVCFCMVALKPRFFMQGCEAFKNDVQIVLRYGIIAYLTILVICFVFTISIVGVPLALLILLGYYTATVLGEASIGIFIGKTLTGKLKIRSNVYADMILGVFLIELPSFLIFIYLPYNLLILPVITSGMLLTTLINGFIRKIFYTTIYDKEETTYDNNKDIKEIITKNLD